MKSKIGKIVLFLLILLAVIMISTQSSAWISEYEVTGDKPGDNPVNIGNDGTGYDPHQIIDENTYEKYWTYCVKHKTAYIATHHTYIIAEPGKIYDSVPFISASGFCSIYHPGAIAEGNRPYGDKYDQTLEIDQYKQMALTMEYKYSSTVSAAYYQDTAYVLAFTNDLGDQDTQNSIWNTAINIDNGGVKEETPLGQEALAFKEFYNTIHPNGTDTFRSKVIDNTTNAKVAVNSDDSYTVGPFNISYPKGQHNGQNKFSWISNLYAVTDVGNVDVEILLSNGQVVSKSQIGRDGDVSLDGEDFYIRFKNTSATKVNVKVDFGYLESCYAEMAKYTGTMYRWYWKMEVVTETCSPGGTHTAVDGTSYTYSHWHGYEHGDGGDDGVDDGTIEYDGAQHTSDPANHDWACNDYYQVPCGGTVSDGRCGSCGAVTTAEKCTAEVDGARKPCDHTESCTHPNPCKHVKAAPLYVYEMTKEEIIEKRPQVVMHVAEIEVYNEETQTSAIGYADARYGTASITLSGIDLTMDISGRVFLDKDMGKTNTGNNQYDNGEELAGVEVRLYDSNHNQEGITLTNANGEYLFSKLNALKKYYVRFTYNGMLYTNVAYNRNGDNTSKATEDGQGHTNNRQTFNDKFAQISSYPSNYTTTYWRTGEQITNKTYLQEDIASLFKEVAQEVVNNGGNEKAAYQIVINRHANEAEIREKVQFVADCRIDAYTVEKYPLLDAFVIEYTGQTLGGKDYYPIYAGTYSQRNVNLGIKARPTFDMALYKDVLKAEVSINGKTETYEYDSRKGSGNGFSVGVSEADYLNGLRGAYQNSTKYTNVNQTRNIERDTYNLNVRTEEIANGQSSAYNANVTGKVNGNYQVNENYTNLATNGANANQRLAIYVTYKIAIRNQSSTIGSVTEIVDYFDTNYKFIQAYVGDEYGNKTGNVTKYDTSMYGNEYKSTKNAYNTIYLRPDQETWLKGAEEQYIYVKLQLVGQANDAGTLLSSKLLNNDTLNVINLAEINGYKTIEGLIDIDSNPGNLNISSIDALTQENIVNYPNIKAMYEDDTSRAPVLIYKLDDSRTLEGTVFEDYTENGQLGDGDITIQGVKVELIEIKNNNMIVRATTTTNTDGWYGFTGFLPGDYTIRYTYGADDATAMTDSSIYKGLNKKSYNGQDYQSTTYGVKQGAQIESQKYNTDANIIEIYTSNKNNKNSQESTVQISSTTTIDKYTTQSYWYTSQDNLSDARDYAFRVDQVIDYSKTEYGTQITNHKAEVFNSYINPQPTHITDQENRELANELERRTYRYAYTPQIEVEVEYATKTVTGNKDYEHKIMGIDFGIVERPKSEITIDQDIKHIKVTAADGETVLFDTETGTNNLQIENLNWVPENDKQLGEFVNIIMDEELISGALLEITYNITVTNNSEEDASATTAAIGILNYVSNNLNFDIEDNKDGNAYLWQVVSKENVQTNQYSTYVNNEIVNLDTQAVILQATKENPLTQALVPGDSETSTLKLKKVLSAEGATDDLYYTNLAEIVEIDNTVGRYDRGAIPGNQALDEEPQEHDTTGIKEGLHMDSAVVITPPTGSQYIYYIIGITSAIILVAGIYLIKKFVVKK